MKRLFHYLQSKNTMMARIAHHIKTANRKLWNPPQATWFTDHGPAHSTRIGELLEQILFGIPRFLKEKPLSSEEVLVLIGSSYLHDAGMQMTRDLLRVAKPNEIISGNALVGRTWETFIRADHPFMIHKLISDRNAGDYEIDRFGLQHCPRLLQEAIAEVSVSHGKPGYLNELYRRETPHLRLALLGALLQVGDLLDITRKRINLQLMELIHLPLVSKGHWLLSSLINSVVIDSASKIHITYSVPREIYEDRILSQQLRRAVEHDWIWEWGKEARLHLENRECQDEKLSLSLAYPLPGKIDINEDSTRSSWQRVNEPMIPRSGKGEGHFPDIDAIQASRQAVWIPSAELRHDLERMKQYKRPHDNVLDTVLAAIVTLAAFEIDRMPRSRDPIKITDDDASIAWRASLYPQYVREATLSMTPGRGLDTTLLSKQPTSYDGRYQITIGPEAANNTEWLERLGRWRQVYNI